MPNICKKQKLLPLPLNPILVDGPFQQQGLYFIGEIHPPSSGKCRWILIEIDYFIKLIEAIPTRNAAHQVVIKFLEENILARFGYPRKIVADNALVFKSVELVNFCHRVMDWERLRTKYW